MQWSLILYGILLICHIILYPTYSDPHSLAWFGNATQWLGLFLGVILIGRIARSAPKEDFAKWMYITFGIFTMLLGQTFLSYSELLLKQLAYGSVSDAFWLLGFSAILIGLFQLAKQSTPKNEFIRWYLIDGIAFLVIIAFLWMDIFGKTRPPYLKVLDVIYAFLELGITMLALMISMHTQQKLAWRLATISLAIYLATDTFLVYYSDLNSPVYRNMDIPYFIGVCAWWVLGALLKDEPVVESIAS